MLIRDHVGISSRRRGGLALTVEHRSAPAPQPIGLELRTGSDGSSTRLEILPGELRVDPDGSESASENGSLPDSVLEFLRATQAPVSRTGIREKLRVNNNRLGEVLDSLELRRLIHRTPDGWRLGPTPASQA